MTAVRFVGVFLEEFLEMLSEEVVTIVILLKGDEIVLSLTFVERLTGVFGPDTLVLEGNFSCCLMY